MGIKGLTKLLTDRAPRSAVQYRLENYSGREIAIDASMCIYQFLIVVGRRGVETLTNDAGEVTRYKVPEDWPYQEVRRLFKEPMVSSQVPDMCWTSPDEGLLDFLVHENNFNYDRVLKGIGKIESALKKHTPILPASPSTPVILPSQAIKPKVSRSKTVTPAVFTSRIHTTSLMASAGVLGTIRPIRKYGCSLTPLKSSCII